jgi:hypothetical protein
VVLDKVYVENNLTGILIDGRFTTGVNNVTVRDSAASGNSSYGLYALDGGGGATAVTVEGSTFAANATQGILSNGANASVRVRNSTVNGNARGLLAVGGSQIISHGSNVVAGNSVNGAFNATIGQQ